MNDCMHEMSKQIKRKTDGGIYGKNNGDWINYWTDKNAFLRKNSTWIDQKPSVTINIIQKYYG